MRVCVCVCVCACVCVCIVVDDGYLKVIVVNKTKYVNVQSKLKKSDQYVFKLRANHD